jgi:hypothetical protein
LGNEGQLHIKVTNRVEDFPSWFELHPTEVADTLVFKLMPKIQEGRYPAEPLDGPNLWRLKSGDRIAWVGTDRPDRHCIDGVLVIMEFRECALAIGEGNETLENLTRFVTPSAEINEETFARCRAAVNFV